MPTSNPLLMSVEQYMADFVPVYRPIAPLLIGNSQVYNEEVGKITFKRLEAVSDLSAARFNPKDTDQKLVQVSEGSKTFKKYFFGEQLQLSTKQSQDGSQRVVNQVLDYLNQQFDSLLLLGGGTSESTMLNNSLYWSGDANYQLESSDEIPFTNQLWALHANIMVQKAVADVVAGRKLFIAYGDCVTQINTLMPALSTPLKTPLLASLGPDYTYVELPSAVTPATSHGYIIVNLDQIKFHYVTLPKMEANGTNAEKGYNWWRFVIASCMVEVLVDNAIIRQPLTFATE